MSWQRYCTASSSGHQPNFAALNRGRRLCSAGRPSRWALAHILVVLMFYCFNTFVSVFRAVVSAVVHSSLSLLLYCVFSTNKNDDDDDFGGPQIWRPRASKFEDRFTFQYVKEVC